MRTVPVGSDRALLAGAAFECGLSATVAIACEQGMAAIPIHCAMQHKKVLYCNAYKPARTGPQGIPIMIFATLIASAIARLRGRSRISSRLQAGGDGRH